MRFKAKVVRDDIDSSQYVVVYYRKGTTSIKGNLVRSVDGPYYKRTDGKIFPVLCNGSGEWMTVIDESRD